MTIGLITVGLRRQLREKKDQGLRNPELKITPLVFKVDTPRDLFFSIGDVHHQ